MNNSFFGKTIENVRKHSDIKLVITAKRRNQLVSEPNYHTKKYFSEKLLAMKKTKIKLNKAVCLGMSIFGISKTLMYEFWYDYRKPKYQDHAKYAIWILTSLLFILKLKTFMKILLMILKNELTHLTITKMIKDNFQYRIAKKNLFFSRMN